MAFSANILLSSENEYGQTITTFEFESPRLSHSDFMSHRCFSRNAQSSRALPIEKLLDKVKTDPVIPVEVGKNKSGMFATEELDDKSKEEAIKIWLKARDEAVKYANQLNELKVHKQIVNRILEPYSWIKVICTGTDEAYQSFFKLRCAPDVQPELKKLAYMMKEAYDLKNPQKLKTGQWHLPLVTNYDEEELRKSYSDSSLVKISAGRTCRVSYLTHLGERDPKKDIDLCDRLITDMHYSPLEHQVCASTQDVYSGNIKGFIQYRQLVIN